jgi:A/G-specific adenine glycosylase
LPVNHQRYNKAYQLEADRLLDPRYPGLFNQAVMELGAIICKPLSPDCTECPVNRRCKAFQEEKQLIFPVKIKKRKIPEYHVAVGIIKKSEKMLITQRPAKGLLGGLWEFPGGKIKKGESPEETCLREIKEEVDLSVEIEKYLTRVKHAYTHFKVVIEVFLCNHPRGRIRLNGPIDYRWVALSELKEYPLPSANHKIIKRLLSNSEK